MTKANGERNSLAKPHDLTRPLIFRDCVLFIESQRKMGFKFKPYEISSINEKRSK